MTTGMLGRLPLSEVQGPRDDFEQKLAGEDGELWLGQFKRFLRKETCWITGEAVQTIAPTKSTPTLLKPISTVIVPATTAPFVAKDKFVVNTGRKAPVQISYLGANFTEWFLSGDGKTEDPISEQTLRFARLCRPAHDVSLEEGEQAIIPELGGKAKAETTLSEIYRLIRKQPKGEKGALLNNGWANIFYVPDLNGVLRSVSVYWFGGGWYVSAVPVEDPLGWSGGFRVFSRNS